MRAATALSRVAELALVGGAVATSSNSSGATALLSSGYVQLGDSEPAYQKAKAFVAGLSNSQKIAIVTGGSLSGNVTWNALNTKDGAAGINNQFFVSGFSMPNGLITTWNRALFEEHFRAIGDEFYDDGYNLINGPMASPLGRIAAGGRQPEGFTPDPYLNGVALGRAIAGMQAAGVVAAGRHFVLNEQETNRSNSGAARYSANADDKTLHEVYAWPFYDAVRAGMMAVMCAMNRVNGTLACQHGGLLNGLLKTEMGFPGLVVPDIASQDAAFASANAGLDLSTQQPSLWTDATLGAGIANGSFAQARLDDMAVRNLIGYYHVGLDDGRQPPLVADATTPRDVRRNHAATIRRVGGEALVLLKNNIARGGGLPLHAPRTLALFGAHAGPALVGPNMAFSVNGTDGDTYAGHLVSGGGAGELALGYLATPFAALSERAVRDRSMLWWIMNDTYHADADTSFFGNLGAGTSIRPSLTSYAQYADVCLCFINAASGEGADRAALADADQDAMIQTVAAACNNTVVVANVAGPRVLSAWADHENVTAILYSGLLGEQSGNAIADVLHGDVNPSGKLAHTLARAASDYPASVCYTADCDFSEGVYVDYRHFDATNTSVLYPFGHGLSYTTFAYDPTVTITLTPANATALAARYPTGPLAPGGPADLWAAVVRVAARVRNTGARAGMETAQLYLGFPAEAAQPARVLRGFDKVAIPAGGAADVAFDLARRDVSFWDVAAQQWAVARGTYTVYLAASSRDIRATGTFTV